NHLRELGVNVAETGDIRLKPKVALDVADSGGKTVISVKTSVLAVDGEGHVEMMEGSAQATANGTLSEARVASTSEKVIDAALTDPDTSDGIALALASEDRTRIILIAVVLFGVLLCLLASGVVVSHRIAGPAFALSRTCKQVAEGNLAVPRPLRPRDLLIDLG